MSSSQASFLSVAAKRVAGVMLRSLPALQAPGYELVRDGSEGPAPLVSETLELLQFGVG